MAHGRPSQGKGQLVPAKCVHLIVGLESKEVSKWSANLTHGSSPAEALQCVSFPHSEEVIPVKVCSPLSAWGTLAFSTLKEALMGFEREKKKSINILLSFGSLLCALSDDPCCNLTYGN